MKIRKAIGAKIKKPIHNIPNQPLKSEIYTVIHLKNRMEGEGVSGFLHSI